MIRKIGIYSAFLVGALFLFAVASEAAILLIFDHDNINPDPALLTYIHNRMTE